MMKNNKIIYSQLLDLFLQLTVVDNCCLSPDIVVQMCENVCCDGKEGRELTGE